jgi:hypothetical protein
MNTHLLRGQDEVDHPEVLLEAMTDEHASAVSEVPARGGGKTGTRVSENPAVATVAGGTF